MLVQFLQKVCADMNTYAELTSIGVELLKTPLDEDWVLGESTVRSIGDGLL